LTVSYGQIGIDSDGDTVVCYKADEARLIARKLIKANQSQDLLDATNKEIKILELVIQGKDYQLINCDSISVKHKIIISNNEGYIDTLEKSLKKSERKLKIFKAGFGVSTIACGVLLILHLIN